VTGLDLVWFALRFSLHWFRLPPVRTFTLPATATRLLCFLTRLCATRLTTLFFCAPRFCRRSTLLPVPAVLRFTCCRARRVCAHCAPHNRGLVAHYALRLVRAWFCLPLPTPHARTTGLQLHTPATHTAPFTHLRFWLLPAVYCYTLRFHALPPCLDYTLPGSAPTHFSHGWIPTHTTFGFGLHTPPSCSSLHCLPLHWLGCTFTPHRSSTRTAPRTAAAAHTTAPPRPGSADAGLRAHFCHTTAAALCAFGYRLVRHGCTRSTAPAGYTPRTPRDHLPAALLHLRYWFLLAHFLYWFAWFTPTTRLHPITGSSWFVLRAAAPHGSLPARAHLSSLPAIFLHPLRYLRAVPLPFMRFAAHCLRFTAPSHPCPPPRLVGSLVAALWTRFRLPRCCRLVLPLRFCVCRHIHILPLRA